MKIRITKPNNEEKMSALKMYAKGVKDEMIADVLLYIYFLHCWYTWK